MEAQLFMANRTNYRDYDFTNEDWREVTLQEAYNAIYGMLSNDFPRDSIARQRLKAIQRLRGEVVMCEGGLLFQLIADDGFQGWDL